jgi:transcription antitermination factor NusG
VDWIIAQLSVWAKNRLPVEDIKTSITNALYQEPLYIYIPVYEDPFGKNDTGFGEYIFINYEEDVDYYVLENLDEIVRVLKDPHTKKPQLLTNDEVWAIKEKADAEIILNKDDAVKVVSGPLRGNFGVVQFVVGDDVSIIVYLGQESLQVALPVHHVRKSSKRTLLRKSEGQTPNFNLSANGHAFNHKSTFNFGELPRVQILRRGIRRTKISIDNRIYQIQNEILDKILLSYDVLDDQAVGEINRLVSNGDGYDGTE